MVELCYMDMAEIPGVNSEFLFSWFTDVCFREQKELGDLNVIFCSDGYLLQMNQDYLNHDYYTDIISFDLSETKGQLIGDVYISVDRVKENAKTLKNTQNKELLRVIFHGALHFCGYKDKKSSDAKLMRTMEDKWLKAYLKLIG